MNKATKIVAVLSALALVLTACGDDEEAPEPSLKLTLKVGHLAPLSGDLADFGGPLDAGAALGERVFEEAAKKAGVDIDITIVTEDDQTNPQAGVEAARKLVDTDKVQVILGAAASSVTIAVAESVTVPNKILQISCCSTSGDVTKLKDDGFVNRTPPSDEHQAPINAQVVAEAFGDDATINLGARNDAYGKFIIEGIKAELEKLGVKTSTPVLWDPTAATFDSEAQKIVQGSPDGWVLVDFPATWQKISAALVRTGKWDPAKTFSADGLKTPNVPLDPPKGSGKEGAEGLRGTAPGGTFAFDRAFQAEVGARSGRGAFDSHVFDGLVLAGLTAVATQSNDPVKMKDKLRDISGPGGTKYTFEQLELAIRDLLAGKDIDYEGASGPINLDENGDPQSIGAIYDVWQVKDQKMTSVKVFEVAEGAPKEITG